MRLLVGILLLLLPQLSFAKNVQPSKPPSVTVSPELERIQKRGKLIVAIGKQYQPPFFMRNKQNELFGFDVDMAQDIANRLGVKLEFDQEAVTFDQVIDRVNQRYADIAIANLTKTLNRGKKVAFTNSYFTQKIYFLLHRLVEQRLGKAADLRQLINNPGIKIGVLIGSAYAEQAMQQFPKAEIVNIASTDQVIAEVWNKKLDIALIDEFPVKNWFHAQPDSSIYLHSVSYPEMKDPIAMAVHYDDQHLLAWLNLYIELTELDGSRARLRKKYIEDAGWRQELH